MHVPLPARVFCVLWYRARRGMEAWMEAGRSAPPSYAELPRAAAAETSSQLYIVASPQYRSGVRDEKVRKLALTLRPLTRRRWWLVAAVCCAQAALTATLDDIGVHVHMFLVFCSSGHSLFAFGGWQTAIKSKR